MYHICFQTFCSNCIIYSLVHQEILQASSKACLPPHTAMFDTQTADSSIEPTGAVSPVKLDLQTKTHGHLDWWKYHHINVVGCVT